VSPAGQSDTGAFRKGKESIYSHESRNIAVAGPGSRLVALGQHGRDEVAAAASQHHADLIADAVVEYLRRVTVSRPTVVSSGKA
jgi:hypothetical protein